MMTMFNHDYIDILKIDAEYNEWHWLAKEHHLLDRVGQLLVQLHSYDLSKVPSYGKKPTLHFMDELEKHGMRLYNKEYDLETRQLVDLSFIQKDWTHWNFVKKWQLPTITDENFSAPGPNKSSAPQEIVATTSMPPLDLPQTPQAVDNFEAVASSTPDSATIETKPDSKVSGTGVAEVTQGPTPAPSKKSKKKKNADSSTSLSTLDSADTTSGLKTLSFGGASKGVSGLSSMTFGSKKKKEDIEENDLRRSLRHKILL